MSTLQPATRHRRMEYLDALRFVLALATMAWHYYYFGPRTHLIDAPAGGASVLRYLSFTVEVFFVISGFVIAASAVNRKPLDFLIGRIVRLAPCVLICATITVALCVHTRFGALPMDYLKSVLVVPLTWVGGVDASYWSLRFELFFYGFIIVALCVCNLERRMFRLAVALIAYDLATMALGASRIDPEWLAVLTHPVGHYAPFFAIGMLFYLMMVKKDTGLAVMLALLVAVACAVFRCYQEANRISGVVGDGSTSVAVACVIVAAILLTFVAAALVSLASPWPRLFGLLGKASYPLYLVHQNLGFRLINLFTRDHPLSFDVRPFLMLGMVVIALVIARWCEPLVAAIFRRVLVAATATLRAIRLPAMRGAR